MGNKSSKGLPPPPPPPPPPLTLDTLETASLEMLSHFLLDRRDARAMSLKTLEEYKEAVRAVLLSDDLKEGKSWFKRSPSVKPLPPPNSLQEIAAYDEFTSNLTSIINRLIITNNDCIILQKINIGLEATLKCDLYLIAGEGKYISDGRDSNIYTYVKKTSYTRSNSHNPWLHFSTDPEIGTIQIPDPEWIRSIYRFYKCPEEFIIDDVLPYTLRPPETLKAIPHRWGADKNSGGGEYRTYARTRGLMTRGNFGRESAAINAEIESRERPYNMAADEANAKNAEIREKQSHNKELVAGLEEELQARRRGRRPFNLHQNISPENLAAIHRVTGRSGPDEVDIQMIDGKEYWIMNGNVYDSSGIYVGRMKGTAINRNAAEVAENALPSAKLAVEGGSRRKTKRYRRIRKQRKRATR